MPQKIKTEGCAIDMTPMIDVVFQLIIFFIVTIKIDQQINEEIKLPESKHGPVIKDEIPSTMIIEIDKRGWISIHGAQLTKQKLRSIMTDHRKRHGQFPVLIRGDRNAAHRSIKEVMDICTGVGLWRINFAAVNEYARGRGR